MKKRVLLFTTFSMVLLTQAAFSQATSTLSSQAPKVNIETSSLKPVDGQPATFSTQEDLNATVPLKIAKIKETISNNELTPERLQILREELWRFENAVVVKK